MMKRRIKRLIREYLEAQKQANKRAHGMTLIEIMVVIIILAMLATLVSVAVVPQLEQAKTDTAKLQIRNFMQALEMYKLKIGHYPTTSEGLEALTNPPKKVQPFLKEIPKDPWGNEYVYTSPSSHGKMGYDIESYGPDGVDSEDDIESWNLEGDEK